jgi:hypothetical protein
MTPGDTSPRSARASLAVFIVAAVVALGFSLVGWTHNLLEGHEFRQAQTALTIRALARGEWSFAYPLPLFGPPWSAPMEFPWFEGAVAAILAVVRLPLEPTARAVSLVAWALTLPGIYRAAGFLGLRPARRWYVMAAAVLSPIYLYYSRTVMIESTALCAAVWFLCCFERAIATTARRWIIAAALVGAAAALAKITTLLVFLAPAAWLAVARALAATAPGARWSRRTVQLALIAGGVVAVAVGAGAAWTAFGDTVKSSNPLAAVLTSRGVASWMYGSLAQRLDPAVWRTLAGVIHGSIVNGWLFGAAVLIGVAIGGATRARVLGLLGCYLAGPLLLTNVYAIHDYYHYATGLFLIAATLVAWFGLCDRFGLGRPLEMAGVLVVLVTEGVTFSQSYFHFQRRPDLAPPELARLLAAATQPDDVILIYGYEWNPVIPYFADRRAVMVLREYLGDTAAQARVLAPIRGQVTAAVFHGDTIHNDPLLRWAHDTADLDYRPVLTRGDTRVYVVARRFAETLERLRAMPRTEFAVPVPADRASSGLKYLRHDRAAALAAGAADVFTPAPVEILTPWGLARTGVDGRIAFNAHAPTDIVCGLPPGARTVEVEFGIAPGAYAGPANVTDGVEFRIDWSPPGKDAVTLFSRWLTPARVAADRGRQSATVELPANATGSLLFRTLPGPANDLSFDWSYWQSARIRPGRTP